MTTALEAIQGLDDLEVGEELIDVEEEARQAWLEKRLGMITASNFDKASGDPAKSQTTRTYLNRVIAERLGSWHDVSARAMQWGNENEAAAIEEYRKRSGDEVDSAPFQFFTFDADIGGTPDGLIGKHGCIEAKCPYDPSVHVETLLSGVVPKRYVDQVNGHLLTTGRHYCKFISFDPRIDGAERLAIVHVDRDEKSLDALREKLYRAAEYISERMRTILSRWEKPPQWVIASLGCERMIREGRQPEFTGEMIGCLPLAENRRLRRLMNS